MVEKDVKNLLRNCLNYERIVNFDYLSDDGISEDPTWISSKPSVVSVDPATGVITVKGTGSARIYAVYGADTLSDKMGSRKKYNIKIKVK